jgi:hypothetical protein
VGIEHEALNEEQLEVFEKLVPRLMYNRRRHYIEMKGSPWNFYDDALVYVDNVGVDTAISEGMEIVAKQHLNDEEINTLCNKGYIVKDGNVFAFSRFLMEHFIKASLLLKVSESRRVMAETVIHDINQQLDDLETVNHEPELLEDQDGTTQSNNV